MILVFLESPYTGDTERNIRYARACMRDCLRRNESPFASHLLYTQEGVLDDTDPENRELGIAAAMDWAAKANKTVVYTDLGISQGMKYGVERAEQERRPVEYRTLEGWQG